MLILRLPHHRWSLSLIEEEEDDGCGGGALGALLRVALLLVLSNGGWNEEWNHLSRIILPL